VGGKKKLVLPLGDYPLRKREKGLRRREGGREEDVVDVVVVARYSASETKKKW